jgi:glutamyl-tRNA synthetase
MNADTKSRPGTITRLAPSPTGALHLGNARTFVLNHLLARQQGWRMLLRVEDLDGPRVKPGSAADMLEELAWLGLTWEQPAVYQSQRAHFYRQALEALVAKGLAYPCVCSRKDAQQAGSAPHDDESAAAYPGTCRGRFATADQAAATGRPIAWRVCTDGQTIVVDDQFAGRREFDLGRIGGDFVIFKSDGLAAYQLAVVVDDAQAGVDRIVRGEDLLESAARQIHLRRLLGLGETVRYWHLPLVVGPDGRRLAKRHGDTRLSHYRRLGATPQQVLGLIGFWSGLLPTRQEADLAELLRRFDLQLLPLQPVTFLPADEKFLMGQ